jgi:hypothetical protein
MKLSPPPPTAKKKRQATGGNREKQKMSRASLRNNKKASIPWSESQQCAEGEIEISASHQKHPLSAKPFVLLPSKASHCHFIMAHGAVSNNCNLIKL